MKKVRNFIAAGCAGVMLTVSLCLPTGALGNGTKRIYDNDGNQLGFAEMWNNTSSTVPTDKVLYSQTTVTVSEKQNYVATQSLVKGMKGWSKVYLQSDIESRAGAKFSPTAELTIQTGVSPIDARVIGGINDHIVGLCRTYNLVGLESTCSDGSSCDFATDLVNN